MFSSAVRSGVLSTVRGGAFNPGYLFASGAQGAWFDPSDFSTMFQDAAGTIPCAVGSPVGKRLDKSGRGNHATQGTSASRPILRQDASGRYNDEWDGFDDSMTSATGGGATAGFFFCAAITVSGGAGASRKLFSDATATNGYAVSVNASNQLQISAGNGAAFTGIATVATLPIGETHVVTAWDDGSFLKVQIDSGVVASVARPVVAAGTSGFTIGKDNGAATSFFNGRDYGMVYRGSAPNATEIARTQKFFAARAGVTL